MSSIDDLKLELLHSLYSNSDSHLLAPFSRSELIQTATEELSEAEENEIKVALSELEEGRLIDRDGTTIELTGRGIAEVSNSGFNTGLDPEIQTSILEILYDQKMEDPDHPSVSLDELSEETGKERAIIDDNIMVMETRGMLNFDWLNQTPIASITVKGRKQVR